VALYSHHKDRLINTTRYTSAQTLTERDDNVFVDTDGGAVTITLPAGVDGQHFRIINCGSSGNLVTIDGDGAETVRGALTQTLSDSEILDLTYETTEGWW
jgi:hypothetical protein